MSYCGYEDPMSGARFTLEPGHDLYHEDLSVPGIEFRYKDVVTLFVPETGTEDGEPDLLNFC
jgi:hypothetical protein